MAPQKQQAKRKRHAVSAKQRASHGNNRSRSAMSYDPAPAPPSGGSGPGLGQAIFRPRTRAWTAGISPAQDGGASEGDLAGLGEAPLPRRALGWIRDHPLALTTWILSILGLGVSVYLTITHYDTAVTIACSDKGVINCEKVTTSPQSEVFGIFPVAVLGLAFYCFMVVINSPLGWARNRIPLVRWLRLGSVVVGMGFVLYLVYAELIQIGNICLWCTSVHVLTFLLFVLLVYDATSWTSSAPNRRY
jgi:uncharacterized membrane protein